MTDDLVKRLRAVDYSSESECLLKVGLFIKAADRIEELEKYASIHAKCDQTNLETGLRNFAKLKDAQNRIEELEEALGALWWGVAEHGAPDELLLKTKDALRGTKYE